ncbi:GAP family protein [Microbacterium sp. NPDC056044]|uniref:GAP family protein n=1 Tax=Microbacterium sp. NPDC056044 TaxID=3345690 RepID=UPI0035D9441D
MDAVLWYTIPIAVAIALSVFPIVSVLVLLLAPDPMRRSVMFTGGWFGGLLVLVAAFTIGAALVPDVARGPFPPWAHVAEILIGVVLIVMTLVIGRRARTSDTAKSLDLSGLTTGLTGPRAFAFGLMMNVRPKNIVLTVAGGLAIGAAALDLVATSTIVVIFTVVAASTVVGLVVVYTFGKTRVRPGLDRLRVFLVDHASTVLQVFGVLVGALLIVIGTVRLISS